MMSDLRKPIAALALSALGLAAILGYEGFEPVAKPPVPGDVPTYGYGTTTHTDGSPVKPGETITKPQALLRAHQDFSKFRSTLQLCVKVPLHQREYDTYISLAYNIGSKAFCDSTLVRQLNMEDYVGACAQIVRWNKFKKKTLRGLTKRRAKEYRMCMGFQK